MADGARTFFIPLFNATGGATPVRLARQSDGRWRLTWTAEPQVRYQVQFRDLLSDTTWQNLGRPVMA